VRLGGAGRAGRPRLHYPDLLLVTAGGSRVAVELELTGKGRARRETILAGYGADPGIASVLYLSDSRATGNAIRASARRLGLADLVRVQLVRGPMHPLAAGRGRMAATRARRRGVDRVGGAMAAGARELAG
jgi:hypothetical protein